MDCSYIDYNGYYVFLIIITIVTIAISIALSFYFIFLPAQRIETEFDTLQKRGQQTLRDVTTLINNTTNLSEEIQRDTCISLYYSLNRLFGISVPPDPENIGCVLDLFCAIDVIPQQCVQYIENPTHCFPT